MRMSDQTELHNRLAGEIVKQIVKTPIDAGGKMSDALVVLESVILGVVLMALKYDYSEAVLDVIIDRVRERLAEQQLADIPTAGND
jgi:hypothetical protein